MTVPHYPLKEDVIEKFVDEYTYSEADTKTLTQGILDRQVEMEPCKHGNVKRHLVGWSSNVRPEEVWCEGLP